jgi:hypothetical protein
MDASSIEQLDLFPFPFYPNSGAILIGFIISHLAAFTFHFFRTEQKPSSLSCTTRAANI